MGLDRLQVVTKEELAHGEQVFEARGSVNYFETKRLEMEQGRRGENLRATRELQTGRAARAYGGGRGRRGKS